MNTKKYTLMLSVLALGLPMVSGALTAPSAVENAVQAAVEQQTAENSPLARYRREVMKIKNPQESAPLLQALHILTAYNPMFAAPQEEGVLTGLASDINKPVMIPWNTYRGNGVIEILDTYIPASHGDKALADLEYYLKTYTASQRTLVYGRAMLNNLPQKTQKAYNAFLQQLANQQTYSEKEILHAFATFIPAYNALHQKDVELTRGLTDSLFKVPFKTGWDKTTSVYELLHRLGFREYAGGDYYEVRTPETLQEDFNADAQDAQLFASFVAHAWYYGR